MSSGRNEASARGGRASAAGVRGMAGVLLALALFASAGCSILLDTPSAEGVSVAQSREVLNELARREAEAAAEPAREAAIERVARMGQEASSYPERTIVFGPSGGEHDPLGRSGPVMVVSWRGGAGAELVLESPMPGLVFLDENGIGLVQDGSVRAMSLEPGQHSIRIEQSALPPMVVDFFVNEGERATLRWQSH